MQYENKPRIVIGPEWKLALLYFFLVNLCMSICIGFIKKDTVMRLLSIIFLIIWDILFLILFIKDPGLAPRNPNIHNLIYLIKIARNNHYHRICKICKLINREKASGSYNIHHCEICNVCVEGHENHWRTIGKCVGDGNTHIVTAFMIAYILQLATIVFLILMKMNP